MFFLCRKLLLLMILKFSWLFRNSYYLSPRHLIRSTHSGLSYANTPGDVPLLSFTVGELLERAADKNPDKEAFIFATPGVKITYQQLFQQVFCIF